MKRRLIQNQKYFTFNKELNLMEMLKNVVLL
jgi:hypothetical protein